VLNQQPQSSHSSPTKDGRPRPIICAVVYLGIHSVQIIILMGTDSKSGGLFKRLSDSDYSELLILDGTAHIQQHAEMESPLLYFSTNLLLLYSAGCQGLEELAFSDALSSLEKLTGVAASAVDVHTQFTILTRSRRARRVPQMTEQSCKSICTDARVPRRPFSRTTSPALPSASLSPLPPPPTASSSTATSPSTASSSSSSTAAFLLSTSSFRSSSPFSSPTSSPASRPQPALPPSLSQLSFSSFSLSSSSSSSSLSFSFPTSNSSTVASVTASAAVHDGALPAVKARVTGTGVDVLTPWSIEPLRADAVRYTATPGSWATHASVEARSRRAPGTQSGLTDGAAVPGWTETLERPIASVQAQSTVTTWSTVAGVRSIFTSVPCESRITQALSDSLPAQKASPCTENNTFYL